MTSTVFRGNLVLPTKLLARGAMVVENERIVAVGTEPDVRHNGVVGVLPGGTTLASSIFALEHMIRVMMRDADAGLAEVIRMASLTPAERTGIAHDRGSLEPGKLADLVILSGDLHVKRVFIGRTEFPVSSAIGASPHSAQ